MTNEEIKAAAKKYAKDNTDFSNRISVENDFIAGVIFAKKQLSNKWVSVEERLPEVYGRYLIKGKIGVEYLSYYFPDRKEWSSQCKVTHYKYINID